MPSWLWILSLQCGEHCPHGRALAMDDGAPIAGTGDHPAAVLKPHMLAGELLPAAETPRRKSLIPLGGRVSLGVAGRPYLAAQGQMSRKPEHLATHCVTMWQRRLQRPLHASPTADFLSGFYPQPDGGGLWPYHRAPRGPWCLPGREVQEEGDHVERAPTPRALVASGRQGWARGMGPQAGCAPFMGRPCASAIGRRVKGSPIAAGTGTLATPWRPERPRVEGRTSRSRACEGCPRWSRYPRPQACTAGYNNRGGHANRTHSRRLRLYQNGSPSTGRGWTRARRRQRGTDQQEKNDASRNVLGRPRTRRGGHSQRTPPPLER